jgi:hypothetical protein
MSDESFSLDQLYQAIEQHLVSNLSGIKAVTAWPNIKDRIALPVVFIEMAEMEPGVDIGTGETSLICHFEARIIVRSARNTASRPRTWRRNSPCCCACKPGVWR